MTTTKWRTVQDPYHVTIWENLCTRSTGIDDAGSGESSPALRSSQGQTQPCFLAKMYQYLRAELFPLKTLLAG